MSGRLSYFRWLAATVLAFVPSLAMAQTADIQEKVQKLLEQLQTKGVPKAVVPAPKPTEPMPATKKANRDERADSAALARRIDELINTRLQGARIRPNPRAEDAEYFRRLSLDVSGRIPSLLEARDFLDDDRADKRVIWMEQLLESDSYPKHFAAVWRSLILRENNNQQMQFLEPGFEAWLKNHLQRNTGYDKMVHELLTSASQQGVQFQFPQGGGASPAAFYISNENKAENLAAASSRVFLGVKLECAQCHPHPFAKWTRNQFWEFAAFFDGMAPPGRPRNVNPVQPVNLNNNNVGRQIKIAGTDKVVNAKFLDGTAPKWKDNVSSRQTVADWITTPDNPFFARAAVDHLWVYFFGVSLLEPVMEPAEDGPPAHAELLDLLAREFVAHDFDLKFLVRSILQTDAYQRSSAGPSTNKDEVLLFARMAVRGMSPEQMFDSVAEATEYRDPTPVQMQPQFVFNGQQTPRREFITKFAGQDKRTESQTSILQALFLMHGKFMAERTRLDKNKSLHTIATAPTSTARRVETLYLMVLSRLPRPEESARLVRYIESGGARNDPQQALADVYWALLNSGEFSLNH